MKALLFTLISCLLAATAYAKPISFPGGLMVMQENDETGHTLSTDYTLSPYYAVGLYAKEERGERDGRNFTTVSPEFNTLIKRWNMEDGQGNIYNSTGIGVSQWHGEDHPSAWTDFLADYETRRVFSSYELRLMDAAGLSKSAWQRARIGAAPYAAGYDDVATWFMLQVDDHPSKIHSLTLTPLVRLFYHTTLVEAGMSNHGDVMFNWWLQF